MKKNNSTLLLFGAGASIPFFSPQVTTDSITEYIMDKNNWDSILSICNLYSSEISLNAKYIHNLIHIISNNQFESNFEKICNTIDNIAFAKMSRDWNNPFKNELEYLTKCGIITFNNKIIPDIKYLPFLYRCLIIDFIYQAKKCDKYFELKEKQLNFIKQIESSTYENISLVSLNYDDILRDTIGRQYYNGFDKTTYTTHTTFNHEKFFKQEKTISYLHGNIRFGYLIETFELSNIPTISERIEDLLKHEYKIHYNPYSDKKGTTFNTFITTGLSKDIALNSIPYNHYYNKFTRDIFQSNLLIIIGYSFNDEHINRLLSSFLCINDYNKVLIIDYWNGNKSQLRFGDNLFSKIGKVFNIIEEYNIKMEHGDFGMIYPRIYFYKNGYECFLNGFNIVIDYVQKL